MRPSQAALLTFAALASLAPLAPAQLGTVVVSSSYLPRSVHPAGNQVFCCMTESGRQITVDATVVSAPTVAGIYNPPNSDQFGDAMYTREFGGRLVAGHRFGNVNATDTSAAPFMLNVDTESTIYHHEGLEVFTNSAGTWVAYSEQNTSSGNAGGLIMYSMTASGLTPVGSVLNNDQGGNDLELSPKARTIYQLGEIGGPGDVRFWVYDSDVAGGFASPTRILDVPLPGATVRYASSQMERNIQGNNLVLTRGWEGLSVVDTQIPTSPTFNMILQMPGFLFFDGVRFFPNTNIAVVWGVVRVGSVDTDFLLFFDATNPGFLIPLGGTIYPKRVNDIRMQGPRIYLLCTNRTTGDAELDIW